MSTAPGADGIVRRIEVPSRDGSNTNWAVFALANTSDEQIDRLMVAPNYKLVGSDLFWPDLGSSRIAAITPSQGIAPERQKSLEADVFLVTLDPGSIVTFVAELTTPNLPEVRVWEPDVYEETVNAYTLYRGHHSGHFRPAGAVPDHSVRGQGHGDVPGNRRACLVRAGLSVHRFRLLGHGLQSGGRRQPAGQAPALR